MAGKGGDAKGAGLKIWQAGGDGAELLEKPDVGKIPAKCRKASFCRIEQRFGRADEPAGGIDDADLGQRVADIGGIVDKSSGAQEIDARHHQRGGTAVWWAHRREVDRR